MKQVITALKNVFFGTDFSNQDQKVFFKTSCSVSNKSARINKRNLIINTLVLLFINTLAFAQPASNDPSFNTFDDGTNGQASGTNNVTDIAFQSDEKIILGGLFTSYNGFPTNRIVRLNSDGTFDPSFTIGTGFNSNVTEIVALPDDKLIVAGNFTLFNGVSINRIARLNSDGSLDLTFNPGLGLNSTPYSLALQSDGKIVVVGDFTSFNGTAINRIVRLNPDGSLDGTFTPGSGLNNLVTSISIQADDKIVIGGDFTSVNGSSRNRIARLNANGTLDASFTIGSGFLSQVICLAIQADGKIVAAGTFNNYNGTTINDIARLNTNGTIDLTFNPGTGFDNFVRCITIQADGKIVAGGDFDNYNGVNRNGITRINSDGTTDASFNPGFALVSGSIYETAIQSDGKILVGGYYAAFNYAPKSGITRLFPSGSVDFSFNPVRGADGYVLATALQTDGKIIVGGRFSTFNESVSRDIVRLNSDGSLDPSFNVGSGFNFDVFTIAIQTDGKILAGGVFTNYNGFTANRIVRLNTDGSIDPTFTTGSGFNSPLQKIAIQTDGKIVVIGTFNNYNGTTINDIARLNTNGSLDVSFYPGTGLNGTPYTLNIQTDGKILVGGDFTTFDGTSRGRLVRLNTNGSIDGLFNNGLGFNDAVTGVGIQPDGKIVVGGQFTSYNMGGGSRIVRLIPSGLGSLDGTFITGSGITGNSIAIAIQPNGKIIIAGDFSSYNGVPRARILQLNTNGTLDLPFDPGTGFNANVQSLSLQSDGRIIAAGDFTSYNGVIRNRIARLLNCTPSTSTNVISSCNPITWINGVTYSVSNSIATHILTNAAGCDSIITLNYTRLMPSSGTATITSCNPITWIDGVTYSASNSTATHVLTNAVGCDSTVTLNFTRLLPTSGTATITSCNPITWIDGVTYSSNNSTATHTLTNAAGCDSIVTLNFTRLLPSFSTSVISSCNPITWINGVTYSSSNSIATHTLTNTAGCDSTITLNFTRLLPTSGTAVISSCNPITWIDGITYSSNNNTATYTLTNAAGCDSVVTLNYTRLLTSSGTATITSCNPITWINGVTYSSSNSIATHTLTNAAGCDSIVTLNFTRLLPSTGTATITSCNPITWINGVTYSSSNSIATHTLTNAAGCDSIVTLNFTRLLPSFSTSVISSCNPITWINGNTYSTSNSIATHTLTNAVGCDSIITLNYTRLLPTSGTAVISSCNPITWIDGITYSSNNNTATYTLTNAAGCDSVVTLNYTRLLPTSGTAVISSCNPITWIDGNTYSTSNSSATHILTNAVGCDSIVTLNFTRLMPTSGTSVISSCTPITWIDGNTYSTSNSTATHILTNAVGCDSTVTLNFTRLMPTSGTATITSCTPITWIDGNTYSTSNSTATHILTNAVGCDSTVTLNFTRLMPTSGTATITSCTPITWIDGVTYSTSTNTPTFTLTNAVGCDSVVTLNLTINSVSNLSTTLTGATISANNSSASYQWLDCNNSFALISGQTAQTFSPSINGSYAVQLTQNGCVDTSACVVVNSVGVEENTFTENFTIYPNPTNGSVIIDFENKQTEVKIAVYSVTGQLIKEDVINNVISIPFEMEVPKGVYIMKITNSIHQNAIVKLIKE